LRPRLLLCQLPLHIIPCVVMLARAMYASAAFGAIVVLLEGCGGGGTTTTTAAPNTTTATPTTTATTATTTTTTTTNLGQCKGNDLDTIWTGKSMAVPCFCLYTNQCLDQDKFKECRGLSFPDKAMEECQMKLCHQYTVALTASTASFANMKDQTDILTIPNIWFDDITVMMNAGDDPDCHTPKLLLKEMMQQGRLAYRKALGGGDSPNQQCIHLPAKVDVKWVHLHTFKDKVPGEGLPSKPPNATCAEITEDIDKDVDAMIVNIKTLDVVESVV